jgi:uncharacterized damage-inducible protein DinB
MDCKEGALEIVQQVERILDQLAQDKYANPLEVLNGSSLGQHFRHIIEFYHCLVDGVDQGIIDYASRKRDTRIEQDVRFAKSSYLRLIQQLKALDEDRIIRVKADFNAEERPVVGSTLGRELMFAYDHAIHHLAIIKIGIQQELPELALDQQLGVAPSTIKHINHVNQ